MTLAVILTLLLGQVTPSPSPATSASASPCQQEADVTKPAIPHDFDRREVEGPIFATIAVVIKPDGKIKTAGIYKSSGDPSFDDASLYAALASKYRPKIVDCTPVEATVYFKTSYTPDGY